jgi:hypothetical protein
MKRVCAWCDGDMGETFGPSELTTHGICAKCQDKVSAAIGRRTSVCEIHGRYWPGPSWFDGKPTCPKCDEEMDHPEPKLGTFSCDPTARDSRGFPLERDQLD